MPIDYKFIFNILPDPVVIIDQEGNILDSNNCFEELFDISDNPAKVDSFLIDKKHLKEILHNLLRYHKVMIDKIMVKTLGGNTQVFELKATIVSESNGLYMLVFNSLHVKTDLQRKYFEQVFALELNALNPYLNKTGKEMVLRKIKSNNAVSSISNELNSNITTEKLSEESIQDIRIEFPFFSKRELMLAYYLGNGAKIHQLETIFGKTSNSIRVMLHRMVKKTVYADTINFIDKIKVILKK